jgi:hypothetical protein
VGSIECSDDGLLRLLESLRRVRGPMLIERGLLLLRRQPNGEHGAIEMLLRGLPIFDGGDKAREQFLLEVREFGHSGHIDDADVNLPELVSEFDHGDNLSLIGARRDKDEAIRETSRRAAIGRRPICEEHKRRPMADYFKRRLPLSRRMVAAGTLPPGEPLSTARGGMLS